VARFQQHRTIRARRPVLPLRSSEDTREKNPESCAAEPPLTVQSLGEFCIGRAAPESFEDMSRGIVVIHTWSQPANTDRKHVRLERMAGTS
jgi:hypothetical protein